MLCIALLVLGLGASMPTSAFSPYTPGGAPCRVAVVGAGAGGAYTAFRLDSSDVCVFEREQRVGGRALSLRQLGPHRDLTVDLGAYRFCPVTAPPYPENCDMGMPLIANLVKNALNLTSKAYEHDGSEGGLHVLTDKEGENAGYSLKEEAMLAASSARLAYGHHVERIEVLEIPADSPSGGQQFVLHFKGQPSVACEKLLLNMPLYPLLRLLHASPTVALLGADPMGNAFPRALTVPYVFRSAKVYAHYDWAWWRSLGLTEGPFEYMGSHVARGCTGEELQCWDWSQTMPIAGRYHDGHVRCADGNQTGERCRGFLQTAYVSDGDGHSPSNTSYFEAYQQNGDPPYTLLNESTADGQQFLGDLHRQLMTMHAEKLEAAGLTQRARKAKPSFALVSVWNQDAPGFGGGTHGWKLGPVKTGGHAPGAVAGGLTELAMQPWVGRDLYVANSAFNSGSNGDWAEGSLEMAENVLRKHFDLPPPSWIVPAVYRDILFPMNGGKPQGGAPAPAPPAGSFTCAERISRARARRALGQAPKAALRPHPKRFVMAAPYTPFDADGRAPNVSAIALLAAAMPGWGVNAVFVMGGKGQFDTMGLAERKAVAAAWVEQGHRHGLYIIVQVGSCVQREAEELAAHAEAVAADAICSIGPYCELVGGAGARSGYSDPNGACGVAEYLSPVAAAAPKTPFWYYHTPGTSGVALNGVKLADLLELAHSGEFPDFRLDGCKFESNNVEEWREVAPWQNRTHLVWAEGHDMAHFAAGGEGAGAYVPEELGPSYIRLTAALAEGDRAAAQAESAWATKAMGITGGAIGAPERGLFGELCGVEMGPFRAPGVTATPAQLAGVRAALTALGKSPDGSGDFFAQRAPTEVGRPQRSSERLSATTRAGTARAILI